MIYNKEMLVVALSQKTGMTKASSADAVESILNIVTDLLANGDKLQLVGFGTFEVKNRSARVGRNPLTNQQLMIPAKKVPVFRPGKKLKESVQ